jgi:hypothetical protein
LGKLFVELEEEKIIRGQSSELMKEKTTRADINQPTSEHPYETWWPNYDDLERVFNQFACFMIERKSSHTPCYPTAKVYR